MERKINEKTWVNVREIGVMLNVHAFVVYSYLMQIGVRCIKDRYGNGYVNGVDITKNFEGLKKFDKRIEEEERLQSPQRVSFHCPKIGIHNDWESKADGLDKVKKDFYASYTNQIYRINHYQNLKKALFRWERATRVWKYVEEERTAQDPNEWMESISLKYKLCNTIYDEERRKSVLDTI